MLANSAGEARAALRRRRSQIPRDHRGRREGGGVTWWGGGDWRSDVILSSTPLPPGPARREAAQGTLARVAPQLRAAMPGVVVGPKDGNTSLQLRTATPRCRPAFCRRRPSARPSATAATGLRCARDPCLRCARDPRASCTPRLFLAKPGKPLAPETMPQPSQWAFGACPGLVPGPLPSPRQAPPAARVSRRRT